MRSAPVTEVKNRLSHYLRIVARGETVTILDRGRPVARLTRVENGEPDLERLVASGVARAPLEPLPHDFLDRKLPRPRKSVTQALVDDRDDRV